MQVWGSAGKQVPTLPWTPAAQWKEDGLVGAANFEQLLQEQIEVHGKAGNHGGGVRTLEKKQEPDLCNV